MYTSNERREIDIRTFTLSALETGLEGDCRLRTFRGLVVACVDSENLRLGLKGSDLDSGHNMSMSSSLREAGDKPENISLSVEVSVDVVEDSTSTKTTFGCSSSFSETYRFFAYTQALSWYDRGIRFETYFQ